MSRQKDEQNSQNPLWKRVIGYRSQTNWKMLIASIIYTWLLLAILKVILPEAIHGVVTFVAGIGFFLSIIALIVGLFKPNLVLPKIQIKTKKRVVYSYTYLIIACLLAGNIFTKAKIDMKATKTLKSAAPASSQVDSQKEEKTAKEEADRKAKEEAAAQKAKEEADRKAQEETVAQKAKEEADRKAQEEAAAQKTKDEFITYAQNIQGGTFIKELSLNNNVGEITFYDSFASYKSNKPNSSITEQAYKDYFNTGSAIEKIFVGEPARLLRQFPTLAAVKMTLPFEGKTYSIYLDRTALNQYIGFKIESLSPDDGSWQQRYVNAYTYNNENRRAFFKKFVTVN